MMARADGMRFRVIVADPPWDYPATGRHGMVTGHNCQSVGWFSRHEVLSLSQLSSVAIPAMDDSCLFLWCTASNTPIAVKLMDSWGFKYKTNFVWVKMNPSGKLTHYGHGYWSWVKHEMLLFGIRGMFRNTDHTKNMKSVLLYPPVPGGMGAKPDAVYDLIANAYDGPYLELFAAKRRDGWFVYGNQVPGGSDISVEAWDRLQK